MKKPIIQHLILIGLIAANCNVALAQQRELDLEVHIEAPENGSVFPSGVTFPFTVSVTNNGPIELAEGDSLLVSIPSADVSSWVVLDRPLDMGENQVLPALDLTAPELETSREFELCVSLANNPPNVSYVDPLPYNNTSCVMVTVAAKPSSIAEKESRKTGLKVYPNPAGHAVYIPVVSGLPSEGSIRVCDPIGRTICFQTFKDPGSSSIKVDVTQLPEGMYIIELRQGEYQGISRFTVLR